MIDRCNSHSHCSHLIQCGLTDGEVFDLQRHLAGLQLVKNVSHTSGSYRDVILHHGRVMILEGKAGDSARATLRSTTNKTSPRSCSNKTGCVWLLHFQPELHNNTHIHTHIRTHNKIHLNNFPQKCFFFYVSTKFPLFPLQVYTKNPL